MNYKLYTDKKYKTPTEQVLKGRGIEDINKWLTANEENISSWDYLNSSETDYNDIKTAVNYLYLAIIHNLKTCIIVDCDVDGYTSAAILINFLYDIYPEWVSDNLIYLHHNGKEHGLCDMRNKIPQDTCLIICPDSSSNDYEEHQYWSDNGTDIIILDHHEAPYISEVEGVITVNNQLCDYPNKQFSGAGIVWQFCRAYNDIRGTNGRLSTDLAALGNCGDMMSYQSIETKALIDLGFSNIENPFFSTLIKQNDHIVQKHGGINYRAMAFAVVPFINATVRSGTAEEKDMIFKAMCYPYCFERVPFTKRGHKGEEIPLYEQAAYLTTSIKRRQTNAEKDAINLLENQIKDKNLLDNNILLLQCEPDDVEPNIRGLAANKFAAKYQRPCFVLTKNWDEDRKQYCFQGSARNFGLSEKPDLKDCVDDSNIVEYAQGHQGAFGTCIYEDNINDFISYMNNKYNDVPKEPTYWVDYILRPNQLDDDKILEIANMSNCWGQDIQPSQLCLEDLDLSQCQLSLCGKKNDTLRIVLPNGFVFVYFGLKEENYYQMIEDNIYMTCIFTPKKNEWQGKISGEGVIDDFILEEKWVF